jgi:DNA mismatch repair ATPase MutS
VLFPVLAAAMALAIAAAPFWRVALLVAICGAVLHFVVRIAVAGQTGAALILFRQIAPLLAAGEVVAGLRPDGAEALLAPLAGALRRLRRLRIYARWAGGPATGNDLADSFYEYLNLLFLLDANAFFFGARELRRCADALLAVVGAVGEADAAIAVASYRAGTVGWTRPRRAGDGSALVIDAVRHPLVAGAVPNRIALTPQAGLLLTGANMSGKSTLLRTVGITVVLAQTINTCLASSCDGPVLRVRSLMGRADDLIAGKSYYLVEAEAIVGMLAAADGPPHLFLFDELFRGTNTVERIAAGAAVLTHLAGEAGRPGRHIVIAATHDGELVDLLDGRYAPAHLSDSIGPDGLAFDFVMRPGPATSRNAIALLRLSGAPDGVVRGAESLAGVLDATRRVAGKP